MFIKHLPAFDSFAFFDRVILLLLQPNKMKVLKVVPGEFSDRNEFAPKKPSGKIVGLTACTIF